MKGFLSVCAYFGVLLIIYWPALGGGPLVDDYSLLAQAKNYDLFHIFGAGEGIFWRPTFSVLLNAEWEIFRLNFVGYRLVSLALSAVTALAIHGVVHIVTTNRPLAFVAGLLFVVWPTHPETLLWIAGQTDGLATCLGWLSLWGYAYFLGAPSRRRWLIPVWLGLLLLALMSKESLVVMPLVFLVVTPFLIKERIRNWGGLVSLAAFLTVLPMGYLGLRSVMINQPMMGGGYHTSEKGMVAQVADGFVYGNLMDNLVNAYAPLSNRLVTPIGRTPELVVMMLLLFGVGLVVWKAPRRSYLGKIGTGFLTIATAIHTLWVLLLMVGDEPRLILEALLNIQSSAIAIGIAVFGAICIVFRNRSHLAKRWHDVRVFTNAHSPWIAGYVSVTTTAVLYLWSRNGAHGHVFFAFGILYWGILALARKGQKQESLAQSTVHWFCLGMVVASVISLLPALTVSLVDGNLALARLSYLATTFSTTALVAGIWVAAPRVSGRCLIYCATVLGAIMLTVPVVRVWEQSTRLSGEFVKILAETRARRVFVLVSPGVTFSATTVTFAGSFAEDAGTLVSGPVVVPIYFVDGLTVEDRVLVNQIDKSTWKVEVTNGSARYRSGALALLPIFRNDSVEIFDSTTRSAVVRLSLKPDDAVLAVGERAIIQF